MFLFPFLLQNAHSWWPFSSAHVEEKTTLPGLSDGSVATRFEVRNVEEKFLAEAQPYLNLPPLDSCLHKVVGRLKKACAEIGEEELAKFSVQLLNCQSEAEGRRQYTCTAEMTVSDCTKDMDPDTWNAYHIVSNRARSVCYATRQKQFQLKTELTVNHLASSAAEQIDVMQSLKKGQDAIGKTATDTLNAMTEGQRELLGQQSKLKKEQTEISMAVSKNLQRINHEKNIIASGQVQLASLTNEIKSRLEDTVQQIENQDEDRRQTQDHLLKDLAQIRNKAKEVWEKIGESTDEILRRHNETLVQYQEMVQNLRRMNETINYLLQLVFELQLTVDKQISWLADQIGGAGGQMGVIIACIQHAAYLLFAMISVVFIQAPITFRLILLASVSLSTVAEIKSFPYRPDLRQLTLFLSVVLLLNWLVIWILQRRQSHLERTLQLQSDGPSCTPTVTSNPKSRPRELITSVFRPSMARHSSSPSSAETSASSITPSSVLNGGKEVKKSPDTAKTIPCSSCSQTPLTHGYSSPGWPSVAVVTPVRKRSRPSTPQSDTASTPSGRCQGVTKAGVQCRLPKAAGHDFCVRHVGKRAV